MRKYKFRYVFKHKKDGDCQYLFFAIEEIENGYAKEMIYAMKQDGYTLVDRNEFAGLKDKNGKEIYEGDIVRYKPGWNELIGVVCFGHYSQDGSGGEYSPRSCVGFYVERKVIIPDEWDNGEVYPREEEEQMSIAEQEYEIIGNIYEHPHLMKGDENDA